MNNMKPAITLRVILLEDDAAFRGVMSEILARRGYEVFAFSNPAICPLQIMPECQCAVDQTCVDIIVSDLDMPNMTGLGFIENQKEKNCKCRHIVLMSGNWTKKDLSRARELGCRTFAKPFSIHEFDEWLDEVERSIEPARELCNWFRDPGSLSEK